MKKTSQVPASPVQSDRDLRSELNALERALDVLASRYGVDVSDTREVGYALCHAPSELRQELARRKEMRPGGYNPFWSDCRRR